ncbi:MAG: sugar phosphate nucleotidyltransferase [Phycisphaerales bacterium]|nr:sugar phosphate nucleotidyltransferase [Phycisphaerales bacterium]
MTNRETDKAVILARGLGTRMRKTDAGATLDASQAAAADTGIKALIPIDRPFLDYVLHVVAQADYRRVCLIIGDEHQQIRDYIQTLNTKRLTVSFAIQEKPLGTANAVAAAEEFAADEPFLVINSDNYYPLNALEGLRHLTDPGLVAFERNTLIATSNIPADRIAKFAIVKSRSDGYLEQVIEKPDQSIIDALEALGEGVGVSMNCWMFHKPIFEACRKIPLSPRGEYEIPAAVEYSMKHLHQKYRVINIAGQVLDMSNRGDIASVAKVLAGTEVNL